MNSPEEALVGLERAIRYIEEECYYEMQRVVPAATQAVLG